VTIIRYVLRRTLMYMPLAEQTVRALGRERELDAEAERRRRQLIEIRRWQRKAEKANLRVRLALRDVR
jgi:hypothetical protein